MNTPRLPRLLPSGAFSAESLLQNLLADRPAGGAPVYVILTLRGQSHRSDGELLEVNAGTAMLKIGGSLQFVDLREVVGVLVGEKK